MAIDDLKTSIAQVEKRIETEKRLVSLQFDNTRRSLRASLASPKLLLAVFAGAAGIGLLTFRKPRVKYVERRRSKPNKTSRTLMRAWAALGALRQVWRMAQPFVTRMQIQARQQKAATPRPTVPTARAASVETEAPSQPTYH